MSVLVIVISLVGDTIAGMKRLYKSVLLTYGSRNA
jgi:hypothetical protein